MLEITGDIWEVSADARCIPTNGMVDKNGLAVMGAGLAKDAAKRLPNLKFILGMCLKNFGNHVYILHSFEGNNINCLVSFPTKNDWRKPSDLKLIAQSCRELVVLTDDMDWKVVALPRVGAGLGKLAWPEVKEVLEDYLDDRFLIVSPA